MVFTLIGAISTGFLYTVGPGDWIRALALYALGSMGFTLSMIFYDSLLPHIAPPGKIDEISSKGYAWGYIGGGTLLAVNMAAIALLPGTLGARLSFVSVGVWWIAFTIPLMSNIPEPPFFSPVSPSRDKILSQGFRHLAETFGRIRQYRELLGVPCRLLALQRRGGNDNENGRHIRGRKGYRNDAPRWGPIGHPVRWSTILYSVRKLSSHLGGQNGYNHRSSVVWPDLFRCFFPREGLAFSGPGTAVGMVQGGVQCDQQKHIRDNGALSGTQVSSSRFTTSSANFSGVAGPALFAVLTQLTGSTRTGIVSLILFFAGGIFLLRKVDVEKGKREAGNEHVTRNA